MSKTKKSLAVLLAVLMLASFMPLFASAATAMSKTNATLVEAPKLKYKDGEPTSNLVVPYGTTRADIEVIGGKLEYNGTPVDGFFSWASSATGSPSTSVLAVGEVSSALYFHPTDTENYSRGRWSSTTSSPVEGWPTLTVDGLDATIVETPTLSGVLADGNALSTLSFVGGKVIDADGNDITETGRWRFVNASISPQESGEQEVEWFCKGYDTPTTSVYVNVKIIKTTLVEGPEPRFVRTSAFLFSSANEIFIKEGSGKIIDEEGNDVTAQGTWAVARTMPDTIIMKDTEIDVRWTAKGYTTVTTKMVVTVNPNYPSNLKLTKAPVFNVPKTLVYEPGKKVADVASVTPGEITDENGNIVEGKWTYRVNGYTGSTPDTISLGVSNYVLICQFIPNDSSLPTIEGLVKNTSFSVTKTNFTLTADSELVLNYGAAHKTPYSGKDLRFSTLKTEPEEAGVYSIYWKKDIFDPATADYGSVTYVEVTVTPDQKSSYNNLTVVLPVRIQNFVHDGSNPWYISSSNLDFSGNNEEALDGIKNYKINFTNTRLKGTVDLVINGEVAVSVSPDENGKFFAEGQWIAPENGEYEYYFEYKPSQEDTATVTYPVVKNGSFTIELRPVHTLTIVIGDTVHTEEARYGSAAGEDWRNMTEINWEDFDRWVFTDENGKEFTPKSPYDGTDPIKSDNCYIIMPDHDVTATAKLKGADGLFGDDSSGLGSLWNFWQKLINFIIEIYTQIMNVFVPSVEQGW